MHLCPNITIEVGHEWVITSHCFISIVDIIVDAQNLDDGLGNTC